MQILKRKDIKKLKIYINEFVISNRIDSKEDIAINFLRYLRKNKLKIEDGYLMNELFDLIEEKLNLK